MSQRSSRSYLQLSAALAAAAGVLGGMAIGSFGAVPSAPSTAPTLILPGTPGMAPATAPAATASAEPIRLVPGTVPPMPATAPSTMPAAAATAPAADVAAVTQPFVGTITGDKVYVRSGPDQKYYEIGQLVKGDLVYVMGVNKGWYQILPPNGSFCLLDKQFVAQDAGATTGTLTGDYVNVHAGSAIYKGDPYAVLPPSLRKGTKVRILGSTDKYYEIAPPEKALFFVSAQFVKAAPTGADYKAPPQLKLPAGATGPAGVTVETPTTLPTVAVTTPGPETPRVEAPTTGPAVAGGGTTPGQPVAGGDAGTSTAPALPPIQPRVTFSQTATAKFNEANGRYQEEARKPLVQQNLEALEKDFKDILAMENLSPSVKAGATANLSAIDRTIAVQKLMADQAAANQATKQQTDALRQQFTDAERAIAAARDAGPYSAEGVLQSSTIVEGKYALVNPQTGRVVAYVDPSMAAVDIGALIGKYIGVRGISKKMEGSDIVLIQVNNATLMPQPK